MKQKILMTLALLITAVTGTWAQDYTITLPTVSNGSVAAKVNDTPVTSAAAGATVSLVATPDAGYKLKTISATTYNISETFSSGANTRTGTYFSVSGSNYVYGWRIGSGDHYTLTISSLSNQNLSQVVLTVGGPANAKQRNISHLQADHGTLSATGTAQGSTVTITGINSPTVVVSAPSSSNAASMWTFTQAKIDGLGSTALTLTATGDDNVKTFTMPSSNVTVSAEFELAPINVTANEGATGEYWATYYNSTTSFTADANTTVFQAALSGDQLTLTVVPDREIPADKAVILKSSAATITLTPATTTQTLSGNMLQGTTAELTGAAGNIYVLNKGSQGVGFYKLSASGTIDANKAYLTYSASARDFVGSYETTGISEKVIVNSEKFDGEWYDLGGRRIAQPTKGIYIINGKKIVIK